MKKSIFVSLLIFAAFNYSVAQKTMEVKINTSAQCGMCKDRIEKALSYEKGVTGSSLDTETKAVTVTYKPDKTNPDKIRVAISKAGYEADDLKADPIAYEKLPACCKKKEDVIKCNH